MNHVRVSPKEKRSINTLGNVWTLLLNTQVRQIQTVKLEWQSPYWHLGWWGRKSCEWQPSWWFQKKCEQELQYAEMTAIATPMRQEDHSSTLYTPLTLHRPKLICIGICPYPPLPLSEDWGMGGGFSSLKGELTQSMLLFLPSLSSSDFPHCSFFIVCRWFLAFNLFF